MVFFLVEMKEDQEKNLLEIDLIMMRERYALVRNLQTSF